MKYSIGQIVYTGKAKDRTQAQTYNHFEINGGMSCSDGSFFIPKIGWCEIRFTENTIIAHSPGLPTIICPTPFETVIVKLPAMAKPI